jgi:hypothetical protein
LTRSYESNGPDVKIRGNAQHVAEKYLQLARDAHTGGDPVAAENYLQHAEHYFRIIAAAQAAQALAQSGGQPRPAGEGDSEDLEDDDDFSTLSDRFASPSERAAALQPQNAFQGQPGAPNAPQPFVDRQGFEGDRQQGSHDRGGFQPRQDRQGNRFPDRGPRQDRQFGDRGDRGEGYRDNRQNRDRDNRQRDFRPYRDANQQQQPQRESEQDQPGAGALPSFITGPARAAGPESEAQPPSGETSFGEVERNEGQPSFGEGAAGDARFPRGRRRRLRSPYGFNAAQSDEEGSNPQPNPVSDESQVNE